MASNEVTMSDSGVQFFEGVEKLLEIWFTTSDNNKMHADLRKIPRMKLENILKNVRCEIISFTSNDLIDAYVLSESSMFISKRRFILKTCGTTTPLMCLEALLLLVEQYAGFTEVEELFYSRKNYKRPQLQIGPHQDFDREVALLDNIFPGGSAYCLGTANTDCWYLYILNPPEDSNTDITIGNNDADQTLEVIMSDLDPEIMSIFTREECLNAAEATKKSGIDKIIPSMMIDDFLFGPCGYSMNGISSNGYYMTIHITPESEFSYVSFETNIPASTYRDVINKVLDVFHPGRFIITLVNNKGSAACQVPKEIQHSTTIKDWKQCDMQHAISKNYDITYALYSKFPS